MDHAVTSLQNFDAIEKKPNIQKVTNLFIHKTTQFKYLGYCRKLPGSKYQPFLVFHQQVLGTVPTNNCYCAYVLLISRYSDFLSVVPTNAGIFLRGLDLYGESRTYM